jgi:hypothetical protein
LLLLSDVLGTTEMGWRPAFHPSRKEGDLMNTRRTAMGALALASTFFMGSAVNAQIETTESTIIVQPDVETVEVVPQPATTVEVMPQQTSEITQVLTQPAVLEPVVRHEMIRAVPQSPTVRTLPVVIERSTTTESIEPSAMVVPHVITAPAVVQPTTVVAPTVIETPAVVEMPAVVAPTTVIETPAVVATPPVVLPSATTTTTTETRSISFDPLTLQDTVLGLNHMDRLTDMMDQVALGQSNGSLTSDTVSSLNAERDRIRDMINSHSAGGMTTEEINSIELALNEFNQRISNSMSGMGQPIAGFGSPL